MDVTLFKIFYFITPPYQAILQDNLSIQMHVLIFLHSSLFPDSYPDCVADPVLPAGQSLRDADSPGHRVCHLHPSKYQDDISVGKSICLKLRNLQLCLLLDVPGQPQHLGEQVHVPEQGVWDTLCCYRACQKQPSPLSPAR